MPRPAATAGPPPKPASDDAAAIFCPRCGYDLRARTALRCPECGLEIPGFDRPLVPWMQPARRGALRALIATAWLVLRRPRAVCAAAAYPLSDRDTSGFQLALVLWAWGWTLLTFAATGWFEPGLLDFVSGGFGWPIWLAEAIGWLLLLWLATSAVTFVFDTPHNPEHARRCRAVARLAAAPLLLAPLPLLITAAAAVAIVRARAPVAAVWTSVAILLGFGLGLGLAALILERAVRFSRWLGGDRVRRTARLAMLPGLWLILSALLLVGLPGLVFYVGVVLGSLS